MAIMIAVMVVLRVVSILNFGATSTDSRCSELKGTMGAPDAETFTQ